MGLLIRFLLISLVFSRLPSHGLSFDLQTLIQDKLLFNIQLFGGTVKCAYDHFPFVIFNDSVNLYVGNSDNGDAEWARESAKAKFQQRILAFILGRGNPQTVAQLISGVFDIYKSANEELLDLVNTYPETYKPLFKGGGEVNYEEFVKTFLTGLQDDCSVPTTPRTPHEVYKCVTANWAARTEAFVYLEAFLNIKVKPDEKYNEFRTLVAADLQSLRWQVFGQMFHREHLTYSDIAEHGGDRIASGARSVNSRLESNQIAFEANVYPLQESYYYYRRLIKQKFWSECGAWGPIGL